MLSACLQCGLYVRSQFICAFLICTLIKTGEETVLENFRKSMKTKCDKVQWMDLYNYWITNSPVNILSRKISCTIWGGLTHLCVCAYMTQCPVSPINISLHVLSAASLPSHLHPDRSHLSPRVASFCCPALWWAALGITVHARGCVWVSVEVEVTHLTPWAPCTCWCATNHFHAFAGEVTVVSLRWCQLTSVRIGLDMLSLCMCEN